MIGGVEPRQPAALRPDPRPDQPGHPVLPRDPQEGRRRRHDRRQQPLLVVGRRQVLQQRRGAQSRRRGAEDRDPPVEPAPARHDLGVHVEPRLPARVGGDVPAHRLPGVLQALLRRRMEERLPRREPGRVLRGLPRVGPERDDAAGGDRLRRVLPLLRDRPQVRPHHAVRPASAARTTATSRTARRSLPRCTSASTATA